jgi:Rad3-related DNA helicase
MKKLIIGAMMMLALSTQGQKIYDLDKNNGTDSVNYVQTGDLAKYNGKMLPVYKSKKGKIFVFMTSKKTGKQYKKYLN